MTAVCAWSVVQHTVCKTAPHKEGYDLPMQRDLVLSLSQTEKPAPHNKRAAVAYRQTQTDVLPFIYKYGQQSTALSSM